MPDQLDQRVQAAYNKVRQEMPDVNPVNISPSDSIYNKFFPNDPNAYASTSTLTGNITYNPNVIRNLSDQQLQEVMTHELTHSRQTQNTPWYQRVSNILFGNNNNNEVPLSAQGGTLNSSYYWTPNEMEAFQNERKKMAQSGRSLQRDPMTGHYDIYLPPENGINTGMSK